MDAAAEAVEALALTNGDFCKEVLSMPGNDTCADCGSCELLTWASANLGVVLCNECVGGHRNLGVHISQPLSLKMDEWSPAAQKLMLSLGNAIVNAEYEQHPKAASCKPAADAALEVKVAFIKSKYANDAFKEGGDGVLETAAAASANFSSKGQVHAGMAFVKVLRGRDLANMDDSTGLGLDVSDPYIKLVTANGKSTQTKVVQDSLEPTWNETLTLNIDDIKAPIEVQCWDSDRITSDDAMGHNTISLEGLEPNKPTKMFIFLKEPRKGCIDVEVTWVPLDA